MSTATLPGFWRAYLAVFLSFVTSRLLSQTDLLFVSHLGADASAAFAVPGRLMVIDAIVAFALGPVVSVMVSRSPDGPQRHLVIRSALGLTAVLSSALVAAGLWVYPWMADHLVDSGPVRAMAGSGLLWMTWSIPVRMLVFVATMCLFACDRGRQVSWIYGVTLLSNAGLDWLLVQGLGLGFEGVYIATVGVSALELVWLLGMLTRLQGRLPIGRFTTAWLRQLGARMGAEWLRLLSWQAEGVAIVALLASDPGWHAAFSAFGVCAEVQALGLMPLIALMRTASMQLAQSQNTVPADIGAAWARLAPVRRPVIGLVVALGWALAAYAGPLGSGAYNLDGERLRWWSCFALVFGLSLPIYASGCLLRACYQAQERYIDITRSEAWVTWLLFMPALWLSVHAQDPWAFYLAFPARELLVMLCLLPRRAQARVAV